MGEERKRLFVAAATFLVLSVLIFFNTPDILAAATAVAVTLLFFVLGALALKFLGIGKEPQSIKDVLVLGCFSFSAVTLYYLATRPFLGFDLNYPQILLVMVITLVMSNQRHSDLNNKEKAVVITALIVFAGTLFYFAAIPRTAVEFYSRNLLQAQSHEEVNALFADQFKEGYTEEDFAEISDLLQGSGPARVAQFSVLMYSERNSVLLDTTGGDLSNPVRLLDLQLLPEEVSSFFWQSYYLRLEQN